MKKYRENDFWFEITQRPDPTGRWVRFHLVRCRNCNEEIMHHAHNLTSERLRKLFMTKGWHIGRKQNLHLCPRCSRAPAQKTVVEIAASAQPPPPRTGLPVPLVENSLASLGRGSDPHCHEWQHGTHIDSLPKEPQKYEKNPPSNPLIVAWHAASSEQQQELIALLAVYGVQIAPKNFDNESIATTIDESPIVDSSSIETSNDETDEPADWWQEIERSKP